MYLRWRRWLPDWIQVVPVELPGRGVRMGEDFVTTYGALISRLCEEYSPAMHGGNFALFGHSMGGLLAYGMTLQLHRLGRSLPRALLVSACAAPSLRDSGFFAQRNDDVSLTADLRTQGGTPEEVLDNAELMRITLDTLRVDYRICSDFVHDTAAPTCLPIPLHTFAGRFDEIGAPQMQAWSTETRTRFTLDWFDGGHFFIRHQEVSFLAALTQRLQQEHREIDVASHALA